MMDWKKENSPHKVDRTSRPPAAVEQTHTILWYREFFVPEDKAAWCEANCPDRWIFNHGTGKFVFEDDADAVMFKLMFGGAE